MAAWWSGRVACRDGIACTQRTNGGAARSSANAWRSEWGAPDSGAPHSRLRDYVLLVAADRLTVTSRAHDRVLRVHRDAALERRRDLRVRNRRGPEASARRDRRD